MAQLRDDASLEDVVNEIIIVEVMLDTLEPDDYDYDVQHANLKQYLAKLREMKDSHMGGSLNTLQRQASGNSKQGLLNVSSSRKRSHDGPSGPGSSYTSTPASPGGSDIYTSASQDSFSQAERALEKKSGMSFSQDRQTYLKRVRKHEERLKGERADAEMAKRLSSSSHPGPSSSFNNKTQSMLGKDGRFKRAPDLSTSLAHVKPEEQPSSSQYNRFVVNANSQRAAALANLEHRWSATTNPRADDKPLRRGSTSSSDLEEISASDFSLISKHRPSPRPTIPNVKYDPYSLAQQQMPAALSRHTALGLSNPSLNGYLRPGDSIYDASRAMFIPSSSSAGASFLSAAKSSMSRVAVPPRPLFDDLSTLTNLIGGSAMPVRPDYDLDDDLDARGWGHLLNDPAKTREELEALLQNIRPDEDMPPEMRADTPAAMRFPLMEHQKLGLSWLKAQEEGSNKGGVLADDMGLGKTIQALALMVTRPSDDPARKTNLIIAPVSLMRQWEHEIKVKITKRYALRVYVFHGQRKSASFAKLSGFDVVLTTFGTVAAEFTRKEDWDIRRKTNPNQPPGPKDSFSLLGDNCRWYRIIIDEAQYIKNKSTKSARAVSHLNAIHRLCMTGTPMMNNVTELYSLIHFLRIPPYNSYERFNRTFGKPLKCSHEPTREKAMKTFQVLLKAILLRRTKQSKIDGRPILVLPEKTTEVRHAIFSEDEDAFYRALETKTQLQVNKYLKAGSFGKNYSNILVLLLRLRQACCHPHLIKDHGVAGDGEVAAEEMEDLARKLGDTTISRIKEAGGAFECPVCYDAVDNPTIFFPCGHDVCSECFARMTDPSQAVADGADSVNAKCPECRGKVESKRVLNYMTFKKVHMPEVYEAQTGESLARVDKEEEESESDGEENDSSDDESDADSQGNLRDFIAPDHDDDVKNEAAGDEADEADEASEAEVSARPAKKRRRKGKGKQKKEPTKTLAVLKKEAQRSIKAKKRYLRRLRREWITSAKIEKTMEILRAVRDNDIKEKTIIFSQFTSLLDLLEVPMDDEGWNFRRYDGSMSAKLRNDAVIDFMEKPEVKVMLVSLKAGNAGLNLTEASQVIILDPFWNPYVEDQAIDRAHRIGQQRAVHVHRILVQNSVEDRICELQERKRALITEALDEKAGQSVSRLGRRELAYLFGISNTLDSVAPEAAAP